MALDVGVINQIKPPAPPENPLAQYGQILGIQNAQQQQQANAQKIQSGDIELQQQKHALAYRDAFAKAIQAHTTRNADGTPATDLGGAQNDLTNAGWGPEALSLNKDRYEQAKMGLDMVDLQQKADHARIQDFASAISSLPSVDASNPDQNSVASFNGAFPSVLKSAVTRGTINQQQAQGYMQAFQSGGGWTPALAQQLDAANSAAMDAYQRSEHANQVVTNARAALESKSRLDEAAENLKKTKAENTDKATSRAVVQLSQSPNADAYDAQKSKLDTDVATRLPASKDLDWTNPEAAKQTILRSGMTAAEVAADERTKKLSDDTMLALRAQGQETGSDYINKFTPKAAAAELARRKPPTVSLNLGAGQQITPDDIKREGEIFARTGTMPNLGMNGKEVKQAVMHASNDFSRANGMSPSDVVAMRAAYSGDKASLSKFQASRDNIASFEKTAGKNLDQFLSLAGKIPDTGIPWLNTPIRELDQKLVGSENMAAVNAARAVATNEIAKVTAGGGLSSVLSDAARKEVKDYNPANATFAQTKAVAKVLKQDMENRRTSMDETLADIKSRIGGGSGTSDTSAPKATKRFNPATGKIEAVTQ